MAVDSPENSQPEATPATAVPRTAVIDGGTAAGRARGLPWPLAVLIAGGFVARLALSAVSRGTNDQMIWHALGKYGRVVGLLPLYRSEYGNHPPLPMLWAMFVVAGERAFGWPTPFVFRLLPIGADAVSAWLVHRAWRRRTGNPTFAGVAAAMFAWNPVALLVSGYHCNTDSARACLCLLAAALLQERRAPLAAGLALAGALNVKLIPVLLVPPLLFWCPTWPVRRRFLLGTSAAVVPFAPVLLFAFGPFYAHAIAYRSNVENWGIPFLLLEARANPALDAWATPAFAAYYDGGGRRVIWAAAAALAWAGRGGRRWDAYRLTALTFAAFLVLAPGFGVQYLVYVVPALAATSLDFSLVYGLLGGAFALATYALFLKSRFPIESYFKGRIPPPGGVLGLFPWATLVAYLVASCLGGTAAWKALRRPDVTPAPAGVGTF